MKIIEGMKELKLIEKKMEKNIGNITQYASILSTEKPSFESEKDQKKEVAALVQSNNDLVEQYLKIKRRIELTNLKVVLTLGNKQYSLADILVLKRKLGRVLIDTYTSLNTSAAEQRFMRSSRDAEGKPTQILRMYDEREKNEQLRLLMEFMNTVDSQLEVINATTDLVEEKE